MRLNQPFDFIQTKIKTPCAGTYKTCARQFVTRMRN